MIGILQLVYKAERKLNHNSTYIHRYVALDPVFAFNQSMIRVQAPPMTSFIVLFYILYLFLVLLAS